MACHCGLDPQSSLCIKTAGQARNDIFAAIRLLFVSYPFQIIFTANKNTAMQNVYAYKLTDITGKELDLSQYAGKKILLVNTASACGLTPQYAQLQELHETYKDKLQVIGLPCNDFGAQEPGTEKEIATFCETHFSVTFPLTQKVFTKGDAISPIYKFLETKELNGLQDSEVVWNFQKYLIDEKGNLEAVFHPKTEVISEEFLKHLS